MIQTLEFQEIWQKIVQKPCEWSITKNLNFDIGNFNNTENDLQQITEITYVKILLKQCWQKGFIVNS